MNTSHAIGYFAFGELDALWLHSVQTVTHPSCLLKFQFSMCVGPRTSMILSLQRRYSVKAVITLTNVVPSLSFR